MSVQKAPESNRKIFSLAEANSLLPIFTELFLEINSLRQVVISVMESKGDVSKGNGHLAPKAQETKQDLAMVTTAAERISELVDQINGTGAELKDLDLGLVDFRHLREGRVVYLCWMFGEEEIGFWHDLETGVGGRQPL